MGNIRKSSGFTILEMSIVLLVIGLLMGGIFVARTMLKSAQLNAVVSEYDGFVKSIHEFQDKYHALPGDMKGAEALWGTETTNNGCPATWPNLTPKVPTCDGDGNGTIGDSTDAGVFSNTGEWYRAWQQLSNAGLVAGVYSGASGSWTATQDVAGSNIPPSKLTGSGWGIRYLLNVNTTTSLWGDQYGHILYYGGSTVTVLNTAPIITPEEAFLLDAKIDDGLPGHGKMRVYRTTALPDCTTNDTSQDAATYNTASQNTSCSMFFLLGF